MKWCKIVKFILLALLVFSVALLSSCSKEGKYAINPYTNLTVDSENDESDELLFERLKEVEADYIEETKNVFLTFYPKEEKEQLVDKTITIREPYTLFTPRDDFNEVALHFTVFVDEKPYAHIGILKKYSNGTFAASFMEEKTYPNGCYRFTSIDNGFHIESVKYDSTKEYGNLNNVVYTFDPTEL